MKSLRDIIIGGLATGKLASSATAGAAALCGQIELGKPFAPINALSHVVFGEAAIQQDDVSLKYTATGALVNDAACVSWAALHEQLFGRAADKGNVPLVFAGGAGVAALAYLMDYYLVPKRLTPGIEKRLSSRGLFVVYAALALSLAAGSLLNAKRQRE
jgi:hypothetical protein